MTLIVEYKETPERKEIVERLIRAKDDLEAVAVALNRSNQKERAHRVRNVAQSAAAHICLLSQDWKLEDQG